MPLGLVAIELGVLEGECDDAGEPLGGRHLVGGEDAFTMGLGQLDRADHRVAGDHRHDEGGPLVARSHGLAFQRAEAGIVAGVQDDGRAGLDRGPVGAPLGQADSSAGPVVQPRAVFDRHDADELLAGEPVDDATGDVQELGEAVGGRFQNGLDLEARRELAAHRGDQRLTARLLSQIEDALDKVGTAARGHLRHGLQDRQPAAVGSDQDALLAVDALPQFGDRAPATFCPAHEPLAAVSDEGAALGAEQSSRG